MNTHINVYKTLKIITQTLILLLAMTNLQAATTDLADSPLVSSSDDEVLPNLLFMIDDSGSMDRDYMPDWADSSNTSLFRNADYNGIAYNPAITYSPPVFYDASGVNSTTTYPSQTGQSTATGGDATATAAARNWKAVKNDAYGIQSTSTSDLTNNAYSYTFVSGEYCTAANLRTCVAATAPSTTYPFPAKLRWCSSSANAIATSPAAGSCQAVRYETGTTPLYDNARYSGAPSTATIVVGGSGGTSVTSILVNGQQILSGATASDTSTFNVASRIRDEINDCTAALSGNCSIQGYSATRSGSTVTITSPDGGGPITFTPVVAKTGSMSMTPSAFTGGVPGSNLYRQIISTTTTYPYPGTAAKAPTRTDCSGATCTYIEEMTNYANWWTYYRTRMQMMKTGTSIAFAGIDDDYRVGYMTINTSNGFLNIDKFESTQKGSWYAKLLATNPSPATPLRTALEAAGRLYAGKLNGSTLDGTTIIDPLQYSCQQNFTILSTDGYWNDTSNPDQIDGTTDIGNQDGAEPRPFSDGAQQLQSTSQLQMTQTRVEKETSQVLRKTEQIQSSTSTLRTRTSQLQSVTGTLQARIATGNSNFFGGWSNVGSCQWDNFKPDRRQCRYNDSAASDVGTCTTVPENTDSSHGVTWTGNATTCSYEAPSGWSNTASCTVQAADASSPFTVGLARECQYTAFTAYANASSCTDVAQDLTSPHTVGTAVQCRTLYNGSSLVDNGFVGAPSCTAGVSGGLTTTCPVVNPEIIDHGVVDTCTNAAASAGNNYTLTTCTTETVAAATPVTSCTPEAASAGNLHVTTSCNTVTTGPTSVASCTAAAASSTNNYTTTTCAAGTGGTSNTLADVADYYYKTDLRTVALNNCTGTPVFPAVTGNTLCSTPVSPATVDPYNNVPAGDLDANAAQHMTTFTLGLGASGYMQYSPNYATESSGDFYNVANGTTSNAATGVCSWQASGTCTWPAPAANLQTTIDDLWHAGVNGRGAYFSATNPSSLSNSLASALSGVSARTGASAAATTSNPNITSGDNFVFSSTFVTQQWSGELVRQQLSLTTGQTASAIDWAAQALLDANTTRNIYTYDALDAVDGLKEFTVANFGASSYFSEAAMASLEQFCSSGPTCLTAANKTAASGDNLVSFLRGDRTNEGVATDTSKYYRQRSHVLGDIVNAEAVYVKNSLFSYSDFGYSDFAAGNATRQGIVYAAANDGMLHAFYSADGTTGIVGGAEAWAYIPSFVLPNLYKLADKDYANNHKFYVDGTPTIGDVCTANCADEATAVWKTILVGGLNLGGRGYYALDVTIPTAPKALWEFTDKNMGYTYGNPKIGKLKDGTWVVLVTSGYNNLFTNAPEPDGDLVPDGDGKGYLYVINAATGALIRSISTNVGSSATITGVCTVAPCPSGLSKIAARVVNPSTDNTIVAVYGGDLFGNLWRFDVNDDIGTAGYDAQLLAVLKGSSGNLQPITAKPELGTVSGYKAVFVGTGSYLGSADLNNKEEQTLYGIKDPLTGSAGTAIFNNPRVGNNFVEQTVTTTTCPVGAPTTICASGQIVRTSTNNVVNFSTNNGWYVDLPDGVGGANPNNGSERANTDPALALGTLGFTTNVPNKDSCTVGGYSWRFFLDYRTGAPVSTSTGNVVATRLGNALATRPVYVRLPNNTVVELTRLSDGTTITSNVPIGNAAAATRRTSWRELISE